MHIYLVSLLRILFSYLFLNQTKIRSILISFDMYILNVVLVSYSIKLISINWNLNNIIIKQIFNYSLILRCPFKYLAISFISFTIAQFVTSSSRDFVMLKFIIIWSSSLDLNLLYLINFKYKVENSFNNYIIQISIYWK